MLHSNVWQPMAKWHSLMCDPLYTIRLKKKYRKKWNRSWVNRKVLEVFFVLDQWANIFPLFEDINSLIKLPNTLAHNPINCPARPAYRPAMGLICQIWSFDFEEPDGETVSEASQEDVHERYHVTHWRRHFLELEQVEGNWLNILSGLYINLWFVEFSSGGLYAYFYLNMNVLGKSKPAYSQNDEEFLEVSLFEKSKASEYFYDELNLDLYILCNILYRGVTAI